MMGRYRNEHFNLCQLIAIVFMCRVTCGCAAVPDELEGLAGQVLRGSDVQDSKTSDSVSFIQPVEDKEVRQPVLFFLCEQLRANR